jgi:hypothetical protein
MLLAMDVLIQYMVTLAVSDGFRADELYAEVKINFRFRGFAAKENLASCWSLSPTAAKPWRHMMSF